MEEWWEIRRFIRRNFPKNSLTGSGISRKPSYFLKTATQLGRINCCRLPEWVEISGMCHDKHHRPTFTSGYGGIEAAVIDDVAIHSVQRYHDALNHYRCSGLASGEAEPHGFLRLNSLLMPPASAESLGDVLLLLSGLYRDRDHGTYLTADVGVFNIHGQPVATPDESEIRRQTNKTRLSL